MPSVDALLADEFVARHCFGIETTNKHPEWVGVRFMPIATRDTIAEINGIVWLDRTSAELKRLEFGYTNLRFFHAELCDPRGQAPSVCMPARADGTGTGGFADFVRLPMGEWLTTRWMIRTPGESIEWRNSGIRHRITGGKTESCTSGRGCEALLIPVTRLSTNEGIVISVARGGREIYRDSAAATLMQALAIKRGGKRSSQIEGVITNTDGQRLRNAIIQTEDPARVAQTDKDGAFRLGSLPSGTIGVAVRCRGYQPVSATFPLPSGAVRKVSVALIPATDSLRSPVSGPTDCSGAPVP